MMDRGTLGALLLVLVCVDALQLPLHSWKRDAISVRERQVEAQIARFREMVKAGGDAELTWLNLHFEAVVGQQIYKLWVETEGTSRRARFSVGAAAPVEALIVKESRTTDGFVRADITFADQSKRTFIFPQPHTGLMISSSAPQEMAGKPAVAFAQAIRPHMPGQAHGVPGSKPLDEIFMRIQSYFAVYAGTLSDVLQDGVVNDIPGLNNVDQGADVFVSSSAAWDSFFKTVVADIEAFQGKDDAEKAVQQAALQDAQLLPAAFKKAVAQLTKWSKVVAGLDITTCTFDDPSAQKLDGTIIANDAFKALKENAPVQTSAQAASGSFLELQQITEQDGFSKDMTSWINSATKSGADAFTKPFLQVVDDEMKSQRAALGAPGYTDFFRKQEEEYGLLDQDGKVPLSQLPALRNYIDKNMRRAVQETMTDALMSPKIVAILKKKDAQIQEIKVAVEEWAKEKGEDVKGFLKSATEYLKALVGMDKKTFEKKKQIADKVAPELKTLDLGEDAVAQTMYQTAALARLQQCTQKIQAKLDAVQEAEKKAAPVPSPYRVTSDKLKFKAKWDAKEIVKQITVSKDWNIGNGQKNHKFHVELENNNPLKADMTNELKLKASYTYNQKDLTAGVQAEAVVAGVLKSAKMKSVTGSMFVKWKQGNVQQSAILAINVPYAEDGTLEGQRVKYSFNHNLDIQFNKQWSLYSRTSLEMQSAEGQMSFDPSPVATFDQSVGVAFKVKPDLLLKLDANYGLNTGGANSYERMKLTGTVEKKFSDRGSLFIGAGVANVNGRTSGQAMVGFKFQF